MGPLFTVTAEPIRIARMSEPGRLISSSALDAERRRMLARRLLFGQQNQAPGGPASVPLTDRAYIDRAFRADPETVSDGSSSAAASDFARPIPDSAFYTGGSEYESSYLMERGAFEMRVHKGDVTFVPPLVMTVITQYPEIHFEYTGGFLYVPPSASPTGALFDRKG